MKRLKLILPVLVLITAIVISYGIIKSKSKPKRKASPSTVITVEVVPVKKTDFQVWVNSQGTVTPRTESTLIPEVAGKIVSISPLFREGAFFEAGQELIQIDPSNYQIALTVAQSKVAEMQLVLAEEKAKAEQAQKNWRRLGQGGKPSDLVLRKPQLAGARAALASAQALLQQARLDLQRTQIKAPYAGRILEQQVDVGQYVTTGTILAKIYAVDYAEIRLPLSDEQLQYIEVPELYRGQNQQNLIMPEVRLSAMMGQHVYHWQGRIVRAEGAYDTRNRQLSLVAQVDNPYGKTEDDKPPLKVGQYVEARIKGKLLTQVFVVPRTALRDQNMLMVVDSKSRLNLRPADIIWRDTDHVVINAGLKEGEWLAVTPIQFASNAMPVHALFNGQPVFAGLGVKQP